MNQPQTGSTSRNVRRRRRWYQFSLGSVLILLTLVAVSTAYLGRMLVECQRQAVVAGAIGKMGGQVTFQSALPKWLGWVPFADRCNTVTAIDLEDCAFPEGGLQTLIQLPNVERLYLARSGVRDDDLKYVGKLTNLRRLSLWRTGISNRGLQHLKGLTELRVLDIHGNPLLDETMLECLSFWPNLRLLIQDLDVSNRGLALLAKHPHVPVVELSATRVSDRGVESLARLRRLETLTVELECEYSKIMQLAQLQELKELTVLGRLEAPAEKLKTALPNVQTVELARLRSNSFAELAAKWGDRCTDLEIDIRGNWEFKERPHVVNVIQRKPLVRLAAEVKELTWDDLKRFRAVQSLTITAAQFDTSRLALLQQLPELVELHLWIPLDGVAMREIGKLRQLKHLDLSGKGLHFDKLEPDACDPLAELVELQTFTAVVTRMGDRHFSFVASCPKLRRIYLKEVWITGESLPKLEKLPRLEELLLLNSHGLRNEDVERLKAFRKLRTFWVEANYVSTSVRDNVLQSLPLLENTPSRRGRYRRGVGSKAFDKLPELKQTATR